MHRPDHASIDWSECIRAATAHFRGDPNAQRSSRRRGELRWGNQGSLVVWIKPSTHPGTFHDFEAGVGGGVLDFLRHEAGMDKGAAMRWLGEQGLVPAYRNASRRTSAAGGSAQVRPPRPTSDAGRRSDSRAAGLRRWDQSVEIPKNSGHPVQRWLADRNLWRPEFPLPSYIRWVMADRWHRGAGSVITILAPLSDWQNSWPSVPVPIAFHTVAIDDQGQKSADRSVESGGQPKRSYGAMAGSIFLIGNPHISESRAPVQVCEGLADALALSSRFEGPVVAAIGTPARLARDDDLVQALATAPHGVVIYSDKDGSGTGQRAAAALRLAVNSRGGNARAVVVRDGKDPADQSQRLPFGPLHGAWQWYATTLRDMHPHWPIWEIYRQADIATQQEEK